MKATYEHHNTNYSVFVRYVDSLGFDFVIVTSATPGQFSRLSEDVDVSISGGMIVD